MSGFHRQPSLTLWIFLFETLTLEIMGYYAHIKEQFYKNTIYIIFFVQNTSEQNPSAKQQ